MMGFKPDDTEVVQCVHPRNAFTGLLGAHCPNTHAKINGATIVASLSTMNLGVF